ncbi:hypothetical protein ACE3JG_18250 [Enterobacter hormaechei subsp. oharae]|uniref:hypothetical protein n=1 Tax=Enterobacter hormaechei TaxID=158836 RepID=UPI0035C5BC2A
MSTITKEQAKDLSNAFACWQQDYDPVEDKEQHDMFGLGMVAMDALLASLEAEDVAYVDPFAFHNFSVYRAGETDNKRMGREWMWANPDAGLIPVYTTSPAPVSVPDEATPENIEILASTFAPRGVTYQWDRDECNAAADSWNACRAAMLQGDKPVTTAYKLPFEQWLSQQTGTIDVECGCVMTEVFFHWLRVAYEAGNSPQCREISNSSTKNFRENAETSTKCWCHTCRPMTFSDSRLVVCPECGNKRCPHANDHRNACTASNEPGQDGSAYPAAPQQEVTQALAKGMERYGDAMNELAKREVKP